MTDPEHAFITELRDHFEKRDLEIHFRLRNDQLLYTMMGQPDPASTNITRGALATVMVHAWQEMPFKLTEKREPEDRERRILLGGSEIAYPDFIVFSWRDGAVKNSRHCGIVSGHHLFAWLCPAFTADCLLHAQARLARMGPPPEPRDRAWNLSPHNCSSRAPGSTIRTSATRSC